MNISARQLEGKIPVPTTITELAQTVRRFGASRPAARALLVGLEFPDKWTATNNKQYDDPIKVLDVNFMTGEDGETHLYAICQRKKAMLDYMMFDQREQEVATEDTALLGLYYYGWAVAAHDSTKAYSANACCIYDGQLWIAKAGISANTAWDPGNWTSLGNLKDNRIPLFSNESAYAVGDLCLHVDKFDSMCVWKCKTAIDTPSNWTGSSNWNACLFDMDVGQISILAAPTGATIPYSSYLIVFKNSILDNTKNIIRYGHNNYGFSACGQYLDSDASANNWFAKKHVGQLIPSNANKRGYMAGCSDELLAAVKKVYVQYWPNYVSDGPNDESTVEDKLASFWLPSGVQMCGHSNAKEGQPFPYLTDTILAALRAGECNLEIYSYRTSLPRQGVAGTIYYVLETCMFYYWNTALATPDYSTCNNNDTSSVPLAFAATKGLICANRVIPRLSDSTAASCMLRSASRTYSCYIWYISADGSLSSYAACYQYTGTPTFAIG